MDEEANRVWVDAMAQAYEQWLTPTVFRPFAVDLAARVARRRPRRVLELAAGTGALTRELVTAGAGVEDLVATDLNAAMVDVGRRQTPTVTWQQADAMGLPFEAGRFDVVACQFGVMFLPDRQAAFAGVRRVLAADGAFVFNTWAAVEEHDFQAALVTALGRVFPDDPPTFIVAVPHGYADPEVIVADLTASGFRTVAVEKVLVESRAESAADLAAGYCLGTPLRPAIEARADLARTTEQVAREMEDILGTGAVPGHMAAYVVEATPVA